ncbi:MAG: LVIVD repeat-containing protein [Armatimonadota bacterium]
MKFNGARHTLRLVGHTDLNGRGDGGQIMVRTFQGRVGAQRLAYVAHMGPSGTALTVVDVTDHARPGVLHQTPVPTPTTHCHKVLILGDLLLMNLEEFGQRGEHEAGVAFFSLADPTRPTRIGEFRLPGVGAHRMWLDGSILHLAAGVAERREKSYWIVDLATPSKPQTIGRWDIPDAWRGAMRPPDRKYEVHHVITAGNRAYASCWDAGLVILDISDPGTPRLVSRLDWSPPYGGATHTALPLSGRPYLVVADEAITEGPGEQEAKRMWVVDVRDESHPVPVATFPVPPDELHPGGMYGPHNLHENYPGSFMSSDIIFAAYYSYGVRAYSVANPHRPNEIASCVPPVTGAQRPCWLNDIYVDTEGFVYATDRLTGGLYIMAPDEPWVPSKSH